MKIPNEGEETTPSVCDGHPSLRRRGGKATRGYRIVFLKLLSDGEVEL